MIQLSYYNIGWLKIVKNMNLKDKLMNYIIIKYKKKINQINYMKHYQILQNYHLKIKYNKNYSQY